MRKRLLMLLVILAAAVLATGCCGWAKKNCRECQGGGEGVPGPVIRLGLQGGQLAWTAYDELQQTGPAANGKLRDDFIGFETMMMKCRKQDGSDVDAFDVRLTMATHCIEVVRSSGPLNPPHWHVRPNCGSSLVELLPAGQSNTRSVPSELAQATKITMIANGVETDCTELRLQVKLR